MHYFNIAQPYCKGTGVPEHVQDLNFKTQGTTELTTLRLLVYSALA